jgi:hypothetical protein
MQIHEQPDGSLVIESEAMVRGHQRKVLVRVARHVVADLEFLFLRRHEGHGQMHKPKEKP